MGQYLVTSPSGKRYRVTTPGSPGRRPLESPLAKMGFQMGGQVLGGLAGEALDPVGGGIPGGILGATGGEAIRQGLSSGLSRFRGQMDPETGRQHALNLAEAGGSAAIGEAMTPLIKAAVKGGASALERVTTGFPAQKAEEIRAALRTYHQTQIRDYFKPLYDAVKEKLTGVKPVEALQQGLETVLKKFGVIDEAGQAINEANLGPIQKKVLSIYRSFQQPAATSGLSAKGLADLKQVLTNKYGTVNDALLKQAMGAQGEAGGAAVQETAELFSHLRKLRDMVSDHVVSGRSPADADSAIGQVASHLISEDLQTVAPELGQIDAQYADRMQFLRDANDVFRPSSRSALDVAQGESLLKQYPAIDTGHSALLTQIEQRTGVPIHAPTAVNAGARAVGREAIPFAIGGTAAAAFRQHAPTSAFVGYFLGRHLVNLARGAGAVASAGGRQLGGVVERAVPGLIGQLETALTGGLLRQAAPSEQ